MVITKVAPVLLSCAGTAGGLRSRTCSCSGPRSCRGCTAGTDCSRRCTCRTSRPPGPWRRRPAHSSRQRRGRRSGASVVCACVCVCACARTWPECTCSTWRGPMTESTARLAMAEPVPNAMPVGREGNVLVDRRCNWHMPERRQAAAGGFGWCGIFVCAKRVSCGRLFWGVARPRTLHYSPGEARKHATATAGCAKTKCVREEDILSERAPARARRGSTLGGGGGRGGRGSRPRRGGSAARRGGLASGRGSPTGGSSAFTTHFLFLWEQENVSRVTGGGYMSAAAECSKTRDSPLLNS